MIASSHNIICVSLTKTLFKQLILEADGVNFNTHLVSPLGNIFVIGSVDDIEEFEIDDIHTEYIITDAFDTRRKILFHDEASSYSILVNEGGTPNSTTGITVNKNDEKDWKEFTEYETGFAGQEICGEEEEE